MPAQPGTEEPDHHFRLADRRAAEWFDKPRCSLIELLYSPCQVAEQQGYSIACEALGFFARLCARFEEGRSITTFGP